MAFETVEEAKRIAPRLALIGLAASLWGTGGPAAKQLFLISPLDPIEVGFYRLVISVPVLLAAALLLNHRSLLNGMRGHTWLIGGLSLATALYQVFYYAAVANAGVSVATLITICMAPPIVGVCSSLLLKEPVERRTKLAMVIALAGTVLLIGWPAKGALPTERLFLGAATALCAAASYSGMILTSQRLAQHFDAYQLIVIGFGGGALLLFPMALLQGFAYPNSIKIVSLILFLGLIPTALAYVFFFTGMQRVPATPASIVSLMEPLVATGLGVIIFHERIGVAGSIGAVLMIAGMLTLRDRPAARITKATAFGTDGT
ncbi:MAG: EamA family transporter [Rhodospirillales bacterium]|nr:EamA family transporter [Rhodospirillales bacterium]